MPPASTTSTDAATGPRIGFIGLGDQGAPIAARILEAGFHLHVWARRPAATAPLVELGATACADVDELGARCEMVALCVTDDADVREIVLERGLLYSMASGSVLVVHSTVAPATCVEIAALAAARDVGVLDAPVSGGRAGALRGELTVMVGGELSVLERVRTVLESYARTITHVGVVGSGQAAKLINNGLFVANVAMANFALTLGESFGIAPTQLTELLSKSSGSSAGLAALAPLTTTDWGRHAWTVLGKDVSLLLSVTGAGGGAQQLIDVATAAVERFGRP